MGRACLPAVVAIAAALIAGAAAAQQARPLLPKGGMWQSIPYKAEVEESVDGPKGPAPASKITASATTSEKTTTATAKPRPAPKPAKIATATPPNAKPQRKPVPAAAISEPPPRAGAAAAARELERRIGILSPGAKLNEPMADPDNPSWRRARPGRPAGEANSLSVPFDEKGQAGFVARGYHQQPDVQAPNGNTGATFGVRTRF
jgi:hypothetical protein